jgi:hypothetical protein
MSANPDRVPTDAELLAAVAEGDPEAFGTLYDQHAPWLLVRLRQRTTNLDLADQVARETFLVVWREAGRFGGRGEVGAWIWGIAIRRLLDAQRGVAAQGRLAGLLGRQRIPDAASAVLQPAGQGELQQPACACGIRVAAAPRAPFGCCACAARAGVDGPIPLSPASRPPRRRQRDPMGAC